MADEIILDNSKVCTACGIVKPLTCFHRKRSSSSGYRSICKTCRAEANATPEGKEKTKSYNSSPRVRLSQKAYRNSEQGKMRAAEYMASLAGRESVAKYRASDAGKARRQEYARSEKNLLCLKAYRATQGRKDSMKAYLKTPIQKLATKSRHQRRYKNDYAYRLACLLRGRLNVALKRKQKTGSAVALLGCSIEDAVKHIESLFTHGMSWDNRGEWHIDHIIPLCAFDLENKDHLAQACHFTNLQPLWAKENLDKRTYDREAAKWKTVSTD